MIAGNFETSIDMKHNFIPAFWPKKQEASVQRSNDSSSFPLFACSKLLFRFVFQPHFLTRDERKKNNIRGFS